MKALAKGKLLLLIYGCIRQYTAGNHCVKHIWMPWDHAENMIIPLVMHNLKQLFS